MKGIVVYKGIHGSTEQYALWISQELGFEMKCSDDAGIDEITDANIVIMGSSVYKGRLSLAGWMEKHKEILSSRKLYLFTVSGTHPTEEKILQRMLKVSTPELLQGKYRHYPLHGSIKKRELSLAERLMVRFGTMVPENENRTKKIREFNYVSKNNIRAIVDDILKCIEA